MESDDPILVHFAFKGILLDNALIMGELSYIESNTLCLLLIFDLCHLVFDPDDVSLWKTNLFVLVLCAIMKSVEGLVYLLEPCSFWELVILLIDSFSIGISLC